MLYRLVVLSLVVAVVVLTPAAHASPPDQTWIAGLYDNADLDDVVLLITGIVGTIQPSTVWSLRPVAAVVGLVTPMDTEPRPRRRDCRGGVLRRVMATPSDPSGHDAQHAPPPSMHHRTYQRLCEELETATDLAFLAV